MTHAREGVSKRRVYGDRDQIYNVLIHVIFDYNVFRSDLLRVSTDTAAEPQTDSSPFLQLRGRCKYQ